MAKVLCRYHATTLAGHCIHLGVSCGFVHCRARSRSAAKFYFYTCRLHPKDTKKLSDSYLTHSFRCNQSFKKIIHFICPFLDFLNGSNYFFKLGFACWTVKGEHLKNQHFKCIEWKCIVFQNPVKYINLKIVYNRYCHKKVLQP